MSDHDVVMVFVGSHRSLESQQARPGETPPILDYSASESAGKYAIWQMFGRVAGPKMASKGVIL